jgi:hypothetical protein
MCGSYLASFPLPLAVGFVFFCVFFSGLVLLCYEKQHCSEMTEDNSLQDHEERDNFFSAPEALLKHGLENTFQPFSHGVILWFSCPAQKLGTVIYGITDVFHLWCGWPRQP